MPGADPRPGASPVRQALLERIGERLADRRTVGRIERVAIDGVDGAGKTVFADELGEALRRRGVPVVRASVDGFHHHRRRRYRRGRGSPEGFFLDSYDHDALRRLLLDPLGPGGTRRFVRAVYDVAREQPVEPVVEVAPADAVLLLDGIFLHRRELRDTWDSSVFLDVPVGVAVARVAARDGTSPDPAALANRRYVEGQRLYLQRDRPRHHATIVVDNSDLAAPVIIEGGR